MHEKPHGSILRRAGPLMLARLGVAGFTFAMEVSIAPSDPRSKSPMGRQR